MNLIFWRSIITSSTFLQRYDLTTFIPVFVFSSSKLKSQVSFWSPVVVHPYVHLSVNFSHFYLLPQNCWANFNQTWHKASLGQGDSCYFKWRAPPFSKGRYNKKAKYIDKLKNLLQNHWANFIQTWHKASLSHKD